MIQSTVWNLCSRLEHNARTRNRQGGPGQCASAWQSPVFWHGHEVEGLGTRCAGTAQIRVNTHRAAPRHRERREAVLHLCRRPGPEAQANTLVVMGETLAPRPSSASHAHAESGLSFLHGLRIPMSCPHSSLPFHSIFVRLSHTLSALCATTFFLGTLGTSYCCYTIRRSTIQGGALTYSPALSSPVRLCRRPSFASLRLSRQSLKVDSIPGTNSRVIIPPFLLTNPSTNPDAFPFLDPPLSSAPPLL